MAAEGTSARDVEDTTHTNGTSLGDHHGSLKSEKHDSETPDTDQSGPNKRQRVSRACLQCRTRKIKCTGESPSCAACRNTGQNCSYGEAKRRGLPPGYLQQLEKYVKRLETIIGTVSHQNSIDICKAALASPSPHAIQQWQSTDLYNTLRNDEELQLQCPSDLSVKIKSSPGESEKQVGRPLESPLVIQSEPQAVSHSVKATMVSSVPELSSISAPCCELALGPTSGLTLNPQLPLLESGHSLSEILTVTASISVSDRITALDKYFASIHAWLPMVHKVDLLRGAYEPTFETTGPQLLLWSAIHVCAVDTNIASALSPPPKASSSFLNGLFQLTISVANSTEGVQALILQSLYFIGVNNWHRSWQAVGAAVRLAAELGLHSFTNRTWKACCVVETWIASRIGKVPSIIPATYDATHLDEEQSEEWELWRPLMLANKSGLDPRALSAQTNIPQLTTQPSHGISIFNALVDLTCILNTVTVEVNNPSFANKPRSHKSMFFSEIASRFQMWGRNLPQHCSLSALAFSQTPMLPHKLNLYMAFTSTACLLYLFDEAQQYRISFSEDVLPILCADLMNNYSTMFRPQDVVPSDDSSLSSPPAPGVPPTYPFFEYYMSLATNLALKLPSIDRRKLRFLGNYVLRSAPSLSSQYFTPDRFPSLGSSFDRNSDNSLTNVLHEFATAASIQAGIEGGRRHLTSTEFQTPPANSGDKPDNGAHNAITNERAMSSNASSSPPHPNTNRQKEMSAVAFGLDQLEGEPMFDNAPIPHMEIPEFLHNLGFLDHP